MLFRRPLRIAERARASLETASQAVSVEELVLPSYEEPTVDALAPDADEGRWWLR